MKTAEYYRDVFGFEIHSYFAEPPVFAILEQDNVELHFGKIDVGKKMHMNDMIRSGHGTDLYVRVSDIERLHNELREKNA